MSPSDQNPTDPRIAVIACAVMEAEVDHMADELDQVVHVAYLPQGLHDEPDKLRSELQLLIDKVEAETDADAIVLVYGLCSRGTEGVRASRCRLIIARAHDCITLLLGSKERYAEYVKKKPDTYWYSPGWNKHHTPPGKQRYDTLHAHYVEKYGEDNADYLMEAEQHWFKTYGRATYVHLSIGKTDADVSFTKECADWLGWAYEEESGDPKLLRDLLAGEWDDGRFVVLEPGRAFRLVADDRVIEPTES